MPGLHSLSTIRVFLATAKHRSMTAAAEKLNITQGAVSKQIRSLEERLGRFLFVRSRDGLTLTFEGETLFEGASAGLAKIEQAMLAVQGNSGGGALKISVPPGTARFWFMRRFFEYLGNADAPLPELSIREKELDAPDDGDVDISLHVSNGETRYAKQLQLLPSHWSLVCHPRLCADAGRLIEYEWLREQRILRSPDADTFRIWDIAEGKLGLKRPLNAVFVDSVSTSLNAVLQGIGVALLPTPLVLDSIRKQELSAAEVGSLDLPVGLWGLVHRCDSPNQEALDCAFALIGTAAEETRHEIQDIFKKPAWV